MQITRGMRLTEAKEYVAGRLGVSALDLSDPTVMLDVRKEFGLGGILESGEVTDIDDPIGIEAKFNIAAVLDVPVNCVARFRAKASRPAKLTPSVAAAQPAPAAPRSSRPLSSQRSPRPRTSPARAGKLHGNHEPSTHPGPSSAVS